MSIGVHLMNSPHQEAKHFPSSGVKVALLLSTAPSVADAAAQGASSGQGWLGIGLSVLGAVATLAKYPASPR